MTGGLEKPTLGQRNDLLEIMEDRHGLRSTLITSHKLKLKGESMRKTMSKMTESDQSQ